MCTFLLGDDMQQKYIDILIKLAIKASKKDEVPISAIIVKNNKILVKAYNNRNKKNSILGHAEIIAINKATKKLKDWRLFDCDLYVTLKPCSICENIIKQSRIRNVYYLFFLKKLFKTLTYFCSFFVLFNLLKIVLLYSFLVSGLFKR